MSKPSKFDLDLDPEGSDAKAKRRRRSPMAAAVRDSVESVDEWRDTEDAIRAENDALAHEFVRLRKEGFVVALIPLDAISTKKLTRDRIEDPNDDELDDLIASIDDLGLSNPIRLEDTGDGKYELIQGFRRLNAYRRLKRDTIPAAVVPTGTDLITQYREMVDENLIRKDITFAEMAALASSYTADSQNMCPNVDEAIDRIFKSASKQKRGHIRNFAKFIDLTDGSLIDPREVSRNVGLAVLKAVDNDTEVLESLVSALKSAATIDQQNDVLASVIADVPAGTTGTTRRKKEVRAKTTLKFEAGGRMLKCIAGNDRFEIGGKFDFSSVERPRLERAISAFFSALEIKDEK